ncbi:MAG: ATP-binding protein [Bacteroidales bacterium]|nr:ATP-binding protein [Bacteroidales bacterium]
MEKPIIFAGENPDDMNYPIGIQTFSEITKNEYVYVDKTDLVWKLAHSSKYIFLSRPRRFGKSLLCSTLASYFRGEKELFEGLRIMDLEKDWESYPVFHIDLSVAKAQISVEGLQTVLFRLLEPYKEKYGEGAYEITPGTRFSGLIQRAYQRTGKQVVVIIDEYDAPLLDKLHETALLEAFRTVMQEFFVQLKANEAMVRFCFITGITKFAQLSIFSTINNLRNVSMEPAFAAICGITKEELETVLVPNIEELAEANQWTTEDTLQKLKLQYDGYHFCSKSPDIFNPFSLMYAFGTGDIGNYWFTSGTPSFLFRQMRKYNTNILELDKLEVSSSQFDVPTEAMTSALPLLYQSGYLTIKSFDYDAQLYTLDFPNAEVKVGFLENFLVTMMEVKGKDTQGFASRFYKSLLLHDLDGAMRLMQSFFASIPYLDHGNKDLDELTRFEAYYEVLMYVIFSIFNCRVFTQVKTALGKADVVVFMNDATYVMELKINGTAQEALEQIDTKNYAIPYQETGLPVVKIGIAFSKETRTVSDWMIENKEH